MKNDDFIQCCETYTLVGQEERLSEDAVDINGNQFIKVACIICKWRYRYGEDWHCYPDCPPPPPLGEHKCRKNPIIRFDPVYGKKEIYSFCIEKNKDGNCKDFEHIPPKPTKPKETSFWKRLVKFF